jgi:hypothetical protein
MAACERTTRLELNYLLLKQLDSDISVVMLLLESHDIESRTCREDHEVTRDNKR